MRQQNCRTLTAAKFNLVGFTVAHSAIMIVQNFPNNFNNDRDKLLKIDHRDTLVFLKLASFVNKMTIEISS